MNPPIHLSIEGASPSSHSTRQPAATRWHRTPSTRPSSRPAPPFLGDRGIRALIVTGAGSAFCAGGDIKQMLERINDSALQAVDDRYHYKEGIHRIPLALYQLEVPTIAAVTGRHRRRAGPGLHVRHPHCGAGGALCRELRQARHHPRRWRRFLLQRIVGPSKAAEMTFTGEPIDAQEALACGLVSAVVPGPSS